jgi:hypothetical protein
MAARNPILCARYLLVRRWPFSLLSLAGSGLGAILNGSHNVELPAGDGTEAGARDCFSRRMDLVGLGAATTGNTARAGRVEV